MKQPPVFIRKISAVSIKNAVVKIRLASLAAVCIVTGLLFSHGARAQVAMQPNAVCLGYRSAASTPGMAQINYRSARVNFRWDDGLSNTTLAKNSLKLMVQTATVGRVDESNLINMDWSPMPRSALLTIPQWRYLEGSVVVGPRHIEILGVRRDDSAISVVAIGVRDVPVSSKAVSGSTQWVWVPPSAMDPNYAELALVSFEMLYAKALSQVVTASYAFSSSKQRGGDKKVTLRSSSMPTYLAHLATLRSCVAAVVPQAIPWEVITVRPQRPPKDEFDKAVIQVLAKGKPLPDVQVFLERAPHFACSGTTTADGTMGCVLEDTHGHEHSHDLHEGQEDELIVATYPGLLSSSVIKLPTAVPLMSSNVGRGHQVHRH